MNPIIGLELKVSSSFNGGHCTVTARSAEVKNTWLRAGFSLRPSPLMKMFVPPLKEAHAIPVGVSDANLVPFET